MVTLHTSIGEITRDVRVISGYLSGDTAQLHFGFPKDAELEKLQITWPDGQETTITNITANQFMTVAR